MSKKLNIHIDAAEKRSDLPDCGDTNGVCPQCKGGLQICYGLAGGGVGVYEYCEACGEVVTKTDEAP